jgi:hypothetical protein
MNDAISGILGYDFDFSVESFRWPRGAGFPRG